MIILKVEKPSEKELNEEKKKIRIRKFEIRK
jgi:hypothetical protein